jgi:hypothetical protein
MTVRVYHEQSQPDLPNKCLSHSCSHLCLPNSHYVRPSPVQSGNMKATPAAFAKLRTVPPYSCACPDGWVLKGNSKDCDGKDAHRNDERSGVKQTGRITALTFAILVGLAVLVALAGWVYWRRTYGGSPLKTLNFDNPVYRNTVESDGGGRGYDHVKVDMDPDTYHEPHVHLGGGSSAIYQPLGSQTSSATAPLTENEII